LGFEWPDTHPIKAQPVAVQRPGFYSKPPIKAKDYITEVLPKSL